MKLNPNKCVFGVSGKFLKFIINQRDVKANLNKIKVVLQNGGFKDPEGGATLNREAS